LCQSVWLSRLPGCPVSAGMGANRASGGVDRRVQPEVDVRQDAVRRLDHSVGGGGASHNYGIDFVTGWATVVPRTGRPPPTASGSSGTSRPSSPAVARPEWER
jgi:hypothetical protein